MNPLFMKRSHTQYSATPENILRGYDDNHFGDPSAKSTNRLSNRLLRVVALLALFLCASTNSVFAEFRMMVTYLYESVGSNTKQYTSPSNVLVDNVNGIEVGYLAGVFSMPSGFASDIADYVEIVNEKGVVATPSAVSGAGMNLFIKFDPAFTTPGAYSIKIKEGAAYFEENGTTSYSPEFVMSKLFTIEENRSPRTSKISPSGTVKELSEIEVTFDKPIELCSGISSTPFEVFSQSGVVTHANVSKKVDDERTLVFTLLHPVNTDGTYSINVKEGTVYTKEFSDENLTNKEFTVNATVSGIDWSYTVSPTSGKVEAIHDIQINFPNIDNIDINNTSGFVLYRNGVRLETLDVTPIDDNTLSLSTSEPITEPNTYILSILAGALRGHDLTYNLYRDNPSVISIPYTIPTEAIPDGTTFEVDGLAYKVISFNNRTVGIVYTPSINEKLDGEVIITPTIKYNGVTYTVTYIGADAFYNATSMTSVEIPSTITAIGNYAFEKCTSLKRITYNSKNPIECENIFNTDIYSEATLVIPYGTRSVYSNVKPWCNFKEIIENEPSPDDTLKQEEWDNICSISPDPSLTPVTEIGPIFKMAAKSTSYYLEKGNPSNVVIMLLPNGVTIEGIVTTYDIDIFTGRVSINFFEKFNQPGEYRIIIPAGTFKLKDSYDATISVNPQLTYEYSIAEEILTEGSVFESDGIYYRVLSSTDKTVEVAPVPSGVEKYSGVIDIPATVVYKNDNYDVIAIEGWAFFSSPITSINIPSSVTSIGDEAFEYCKSLTSIEIPSSITSIGQAAYSGCTSLKSIIYNTFTPLVEWSSPFDQNTYNKVTLYIPAGARATFRDTYPWNNFSNIEEVGEAPELERGSVFKFDGIYYKILSSTDKTVEVISVPEYSYQISIPPIASYYNFNYTVVAIGDDAFSGCSSLRSIVIPSSVNSIGEGVFYGCNSLNSICYDNDSPVLCNPNFSEENYTSTTLYIPEGTRNVFETIEPWCNFQNIVETHLPQIDLLSVESAVYSIELESLVFNAVIKNHGSTYGTYVLSMSINGQKAITSDEVGCVSIPEHSEKTIPFTLDLPCNSELFPQLMTEGIHNVEFSLDKYNDEFGTHYCNQSIESSLNVIPKTNGRTVLIELFTTEKEINSPSSINRLYSSLSESNLINNVAIVSHHSGYYEDKFTTTFDKDYEWFYNSNTTYAPAMMLNRYSSSMSPVRRISSYEEAIIRSLISSIPPINLNLQATFNEEADKIYVVLKGIKNEMPLCENPALTLYLVENDIHSDTQSNGGSDFVHQKVGRAVNSTWGEAIEFDGNNEFNYHYSFAIDPSWNKKNLEVIAVVHNKNMDDPNDWEVQNAASLKADMFKDIPDEEFEGDNILNVTVDGKSISNGETVVSSNVETQEFDDMIFAWELQPKTIITVSENSTLNVTVTNPEGMSRVTYVGEEETPATVGFSGVRILGGLPGICMPVKPGESCIQTQVMKKDAKGELGCYFMSANYNFVVPQNLDATAEVRIEAESESGKTEVFEFTLKMVYKDSQTPEPPVSETLKGDSNGSGEVNVADAVNIANYAVGNEVESFDHEASDVNEDGRITVADAVATIAIILEQGVGNENQKQDFKNENESEEQGAQQVVRKVRPADAEDGLAIVSVADAQTVNVGLDGFREFSALQGEIVMPVGATLENIEAGAGAAEHTLAFRRVNADTYRFVLFDPNGAVLGVNGEGVLNLTLAGGDASAVKLRNLVASDAEAHEYHPAVVREDILSGVGVAGAEAFGVVVADGRLSVNAAAGVTVSVFTPEGRLIVRYVADGAARQVDVVAGVYVVVCGNESAKVMVK